MRIKILLKCSGKSKIAVREFGNGLFLVREFGKMKKIVREFGNRPPLRGASGIEKKICKIILFRPLTCANYVPLYPLDRGVRWGFSHMFRGLGWGFSHICLPGLVLQSEVQYGGDFHFTSQLFVYTSTCYGAM